VESLKTCTVILSIIDGFWRLEYAFVEEEECSEKEKTCG
jgi:hypothetical protein